MTNLTAYENALGGMSLATMGYWSRYVFHRSDELIEFGGKWITFADLCIQFPTGGGGNFRIKAFCGPPNDMKMRTITPAKLLLDWYLWSREAKLDKVSKQFDGLMKARLTTLVV